MTLLGLPGIVPSTLLSSGSTMSKPSSGYTALGCFASQIVGVAIPTLIGGGVGNIYGIATNQAAIIALFRVINRYAGNLPPMSGVFPDYPAPVICRTESGRELALMGGACHRSRNLGAFR
jgi:hypothetical protein